MIKKNTIDKYLYIHKNALCRDKKGIIQFQSIRGKAYTRFNEAKVQSELKPIDIEIIKNYVNSFLGEIGIKGQGYKLKFDTENAVDKINYNNIKEDYELEDERDIVWIKFTNDGYVGVVATSNDINFDTSKDDNSYDDKDEKDNYLYNVSGVLIHKLNKKWDESFVLVFPLNGLPKGYTRRDVEMAVGNYLIEKGVPILDFYSHMHNIS